MSVKQGKKVNKQAVAAKQRKVAEEQASAKKSKKTPAEAKKANHKKLIELAAVVFAVIMALTMMLPSLSAIFANKSSSSSSTDSSTTASTDSSTTSSTDSSTTSSTSTSSVSDVDNEYSSTVSELETKLKADPNNLPALINIANDYLNWGYSAKTYESTDEEKAHVVDLFNSAITYYDRYLALNDAKSVHVNRALAQYYAGDTDGAVQALVDFTNTTTDYAPAWADLGMLYENQSNTTAAKDAYTKALGANPSSNVSSYVNARLTAIEQQESGTSSTSSSSSSTSSSGSLLSDLASASGTSTK